MIQIYNKICIAILIFISISFEILILFVSLSAWILRIIDDDDLNEEMGNQHESQEIDESWDDKEFPSQSRKRNIHLAYADSGIGQPDEKKDKLVDEDVSD